MKIHSLTIKGFRNLKPLQLNFDRDKNIFAFVGNNAQGKTNILEAIYLAALSKSFRTQKNQEFIGFDQDFASIKVTTEEENIEVIFTESPVKKTLKINGVKKGALEFVGHLKAVFFSPDDLAYMAFAPRLRRRYLDVLLSQMDQDYLFALTRYESARKQRNALLKRIKNKEATTEELLFWDDILSEQGVFILEERRQWVKNLKPVVTSYYRSISQTEDQIEIAYVSEMDEIKDKTEYLDALNRVQEADIASGKTMIGPQRDDLKFFLSGHDMEAFSSRGEWRSLVLALKFAEIELLKKKTGEDPILLLDDVFSELDEERQKYLLEAVGGIQTFITTTHHDFFKKVSSPHQTYTLQEGEIKF